jgi:hypothetical protein
MLLKSEEVDNQIKVLLVYEKNHPAISNISNKLKTYNYEILSSPYLPKVIIQYRYVFIFDDLVLLKKINSANISKKTKVFFVSFGKKNDFQRISEFVNKNSTHALKAVNLDDQELNEEELEKVFWFLFSHSSEKSLSLEKNLKKLGHKKSKFKFNASLSLKHFKKKLFLYLILGFIFIETFFIFPLLISGFFTYKSAVSFSESRTSDSQKYLYYAEPFTMAANKSYSIARPVLSIFYLALLPDNLLALQDNAQGLISTANETTKNAENIFELIMKKNKNISENSLLESRLSKLDQQLENLQKKISLIKQLLNYQIKSIEKIQLEISKSEEIISQVRQIYKYRDELLGKNSEKKYLILFENNMELRPGGGFIGSYGILTFKNYTLRNIEIQDVYDADGQLIAHIEPPPAIKKYLNQPHWFLRDSNFSPDFVENLNTAKFFLDKELKLSGFDGGIAITTTAINNILDAYGNVYLPDYKENINSKNFYIKTQTIVEKNFFPGSTQKKGFLSSLVQTLIVQFPKISFKELAIGIKKSLEEKHIVMNFENSEVQKIVDSYSWNGKVVVPKCASQIENCIVDGFIPVDANLGVNKTNFFLSRLFNQKIKIMENGEIHNQLTITFKNDSEASIFPGGYYKNYFQIYLPKDSVINQITRDNVLIPEYDPIENSAFNIAGIYFEVSPKTTTELRINYQLANKLAKGRGNYQLIVQKQIGSSNNDFILEFYFPKNVYILNQNFSALAKDNGLVYNTNLSTDKIFFIDLIKD